MRKGRVRFSILVAASLLAACGHFPVARHPAMPPSETDRASIERLGALFGELSRNPEPPLGPRPENLDPWQRRDWREVFGPCRAGKGEVGAEIVWGGAEDADDDSIRFYCNTAPLIDGKRVAEGDRFWATPWYDTGDLERRSFYLERFLTSVALVDGARISGMLDASRNSPYEASFALMKDYWPALVSPRIIASALRDWIERSFGKSENRVRTTPVGR